MGNYIFWKNGVFIYKKLNKNFKMDKFNIATSKRDLKAAAKITETKADLSIQVILNNMAIYNGLIDDYREGDTKKAYLMYQMSSTIFNQLAAFGLVPPKVKESKKTEESIIADVIESVNKR